MKKYIFPAALIVIGSALEGVWYVFRFEPEVPHLLMAIGQAAGLVLLLSTFVFLGKSKHGLWFLPVLPLMVYSVLCTSMGQHVSETVGETEAVQAVTSRALTAIEDQYIRDLESYNREEDSMLGIMESVEDIQTSGTFWSTVNRDDERLDETRADRDGTILALREFIDEAEETQEGISSRSSVYAYLSSMGGWSAEDWIRFIMQSVLSLFIALMAPTGILAWPGKVEKKIKPPKKETPKVSITVDQVKAFVKFSWFRVQKGSSKYIIPKRAFLESHNKYPEEIYDSLYSKSFEIGLIDNLGVIVEKDAPEAARRLWDAVR